MRILLAAGAALLLSASAQAKLLELRVLDQQPFADAATFGDAGSYVRIRATARGELDPAAPANAPLALLDKAPRNARGMVEYETDVFILRPAEPQRGSGVLLYDVVNRGNKYVPSWINDGPEPPGSMLNDPRSPADAGNGFAFRRGYTLVWSGWQPEVGGANGGMGIRVPVATNGADPIVQRIRHEFVLGTRTAEGAYRIALPYKVANMEHASLAVRANEADPRTSVPPDGWRFIDSQTIQLMPFGTPPTPRHIYDFTYEATRPTVNSIGFAAVRDVVSHMRQQPGIRHTLGFGVSLSGRFLRHFLDLGMNRDEAGGRVFDGVLAHIGGAGKVFANEAFAQPGRTATQHEDRYYPEVWEPVGYPGLLRQGAADPLVIESNTSTEYWQKAASAVHADAKGNDLALPAGVRMYMVAGTQHGGHFGSAASPGFCANPRNPNSAGPALRAMLVNLEAWVTKGVPPPDSLVPRRADETGVPATSIRMPAVPGVTWASRDNPVSTQAVSWVDPPAAPVQPYPTFVSAVDANGNEVSGLRLPHVAAPLGTYTGVNVYKDLPGELCDRDGIYLPFARTRAERDRTGDPRPSLEERYGSRDAYVLKVRQAAEALVAARLLLPEDASRYVAAASKVDALP